jgi:hypothetical protein
MGKVLPIGAVADRCLQRGRCHYSERQAAVTHRYMVNYNLVFRLNKLGTSRTINASEFCENYDAQFFG